MTYVLLLYAFNLSAQQLDTVHKVQVLYDEYPCGWNLGAVAESDSFFYWKNQSGEQKEFRLNDFKQIKHNIGRKSKFTNIFDNLLCVVYAAVEPPNDSLNYYIEIYEISFDYVYQCENFIKTVKKFKIKHLDWPDGSQPVQFYSRGLSVYIFLDSSDTPNDDDLINVVNRLTKLINKY